MGAKGLLGHPKGYLAGGNTFTSRLTRQRWCRAVCFTPHLILRCSFFTFLQKKVTLAHVKLI